MPARRVSVTPADALRDGFEAIRRKAGLPSAFGPDALAEAEAAAARPPEYERVEIPFVTIDPPGARDLDQAVHLERRESGYRVHYAIADPGAFIIPGGALDRETHERAVTVYMPDGKVPLHPPVLSEGAASLLPGQWRPAVLWTLDLDATGELRETAVVRAEVRSVGQHTYEDVPETLAPLLREIGQKRLELEQARGGVRLVVPEQEVVLEDDSWSVRYRVPLQSEDDNAQISLLTGMAAAALMLRGGVGVLRTQPPPEERDFARLRRLAAALGVDWPADEPYPEFVRRLDPSLPAHAAVMREAAGIGRGATYTPFDGAPPAQTTHWAVAAPYAHATAPLRRLQDRSVSECCLAAFAGSEPPAWVRAGLPGLPAAMAAGARRANAVERDVIDLVEAVLLSGREGERFAAVIIDDRLVQLREPAVRGRLVGATREPGSEVTVRLDRADIAERTVEFSLA